MIGWWSDLQNAERALLAMERCPVHPRYTAKRKPRCACVICAWLWAKAEETRHGPTISGESTKALARRLNGERP